jgi:hypothetical protein
VDARVHVGGVALSELLDHVPAKYVAPMKANYGPGKVTVELGARALIAEEASAA